MKQSLEKTGLRSPSRIAIFLILAAGIALLVDYSLDAFIYATPAFDQSWFLYAAGRVIDGVTLYGPRITEVNPPLIIWFSILPDLLARWFHVAPLLVLKLLVSAIVLASAAWSTRILSAAGLAGSATLRCLCFSAITAVEVSLAHISFAQREQLVAALVLPYALYAVCAARLRFGMAERIALGIAAAGVCFKPQHVLIIVGLELVLLLWTLQLRRLLRAELLSFAITVCVYVGLVYFATPYVRHTMPILFDTFWAYGDASKVQLLESVLFNPLFLLNLFAWAALRRNLRYPAAPLALLAGSLGAGIAYALQATPWPHHFFPCKVLLFCGIGWMALDVLSPKITAITKGISVAQGVSVAMVAIVFVAVSLPFDIRYEQRCLNRDLRNTTDLTKVLTQYPPGTTIYVFSTGLGEFTDIFQHHLVWGSRYAHLWMLPAIVRNEAASSGGPVPRKVLSPTRLHQLADIQRSNTAEDLQEWKPAFVIVPHCNSINPCQGLGAMNFNMLSWFLQSPTFVAEWSHYQQQAAYLNFDVYKRIP